MSRVAVILAGGLGTRLRSVVSDVPKSLAPVNHEPFLFLLLRALAHCGFTKVILLTGYKQDQVVLACGDGSAFGLELIYSPEEQPLGTAGALKNAEAYLRHVPEFLLLNGDSFCPEAITALSQQTLTANQLGMIAVAHVAAADRFGTVVFDPNTHRVLSFKEKTAGHSGYVNVGVYRLSNKILATIPTHQQCSLEQEIFPEHFCALSACIVAADFDDIGLPDSYHAFLEKKR